MTFRSILIAEIRFVKIMYAMNVSLQNVNEIIQNSIHWFVYEPNIRKEYLHALTIIQIIQIRKLC